MTTTSRREFLHAAALAGGCLALAAPLGRAWARGTAARADAVGPYTYRALKTGAARIGALVGDGGNALVAGDGAGAWSLLIDTKNPALGAMLRGSGVALGGGNFDKGDRLVINTHHHADHTGGNWAFAGVPIAAHEYARARVIERAASMAAAAPRAVKVLEGDESDAGRAALPYARQYLEKVGSLTPEAWAPTRALSGEKSELTVGPLKVEAYHFGPGHTDNDLVLRLPDQNILHMGDLLFHNNWCFIDRPAGATTVGWMKSVREAAKLCDAETVVIPGHGELTDVQGLMGQIVFLERVREIVGAAVKAGTTREDVLKLEPAEFASRGFPQGRVRTLGAVYDELTGAPAAPPAAAPAGR